MLLLLLQFYSIIKKQEQNIVGTKNKYIYSNINYIFLSKVCKIIFSLIYQRLMRLNAVRCDVVASTEIVQWPTLNFTDINVTTLVQALTLRQSLENFTLHFSAEQ